MLRPEVNVKEYVYAEIELSSIPASMSASVFVYIDFWSQRKANVIIIVNWPLVLAIKKVIKRLD